MSSLTIVRRIAARPEIVWDLLVTSDGLSAWMGPDAGPVLIAETEPRVGGRYRIRFRMLDGSEHEASGTYEVVQPPHRLVMSWSWAARPGSDRSEIEIRLRAIPDGTELTFTHSGLADDQTRDEHRGGWDGALDKLDIAAGKKQVQTSLAGHRVVSPEEWLKARIELVAKEKEFSRLHDELAAQKRALPWVTVEKDYVFTAPEGDVSLKGLFGRHSQLFIKHFMMGPDQDWQCPGCTLEASHVDGLLEYFDHHDMAYVAVSRAPIDQIEATRKKMGWRFKWVSSFRSDFSYDFHASFRPDEVATGRTFYNWKDIDPKGTTDLSGNSVFYKDASATIFHTYGTFGRGGEQFLGIYGFFDVLPKGREEYGPAHSLPDWAGFKTANR